ncbi:hypothetical protein LTR84_003503 [Exophiala bonariae]|uniref:NB-ARC domain-containing protein n=1 Tax=Exophiala bonariae TaxID=1690606 RepID=A0AAV9N7F4_9EURO|nr:hypothetical protein LTR84_003503 [Exophiala bonariae]
MTLKLLFPSKAEGDGITHALQPDVTSVEGIDIVAVHGLNEDLVGAWTDKATKKLWLRDLLPLDEFMTVARVLTFGYDGSPSHFFDADEETAPVTTIARNLVCYLSANRHMARCDQRPIIFICHGMGGLIVKKALMLSRDEKSPTTHHQQGIFTCTAGILFFGTPHGQVSDPHIWYRARYLVDLPNTKKLKHTSALWSINQDFTKIQLWFTQIFFWEEINPRVVNSSAVPPGMEGSSAGIYATHSGMVKFAALESPGYLVVRSNLLRLCKGAAGRIELRRKNNEKALCDNWQQQLAIDHGIGMHMSQATSPSTPMKEPHPHNIFMLPKHHHLDSNQFIGREQEKTRLKEAFIDLRRPSSDDFARRFVVYGMGGAGKTELASWFAKHYKHRFDAVVTIDATSTERIKSSLAELGEKGGLEATEKSGEHVLQQFCKPVLLIIDNADDSRFNVLEHIRMNNHASVIITTRHPSLCRDANVGFLKLQGLGEDESLRLLLTCSKIAEPWNLATETVGRAICELLGHLALALVVAGRSIQKAFHGPERLQKYLDFYNSKREAYHSSHHEQDGIEGDYRDQTGKGFAYPAFEVSLARLQKNQSQSCQDAIEILNIIAFYHRQNIMLDIFTEAARNKSSSFIGAAASLHMRLKHWVAERFCPPRVMPAFWNSASPGKDTHRARDGMSELISLSLVNVDDTTSEYSLHPLVYDWARDRLSEGERKLWARIALNILVEAIRLTSQSDTNRQECVKEAHKQSEFHRSILSHLDICFPLCSIEISNYDELLSRARLYVSPYLFPTFLHIVGEQASIMAKAGFVYGEGGRFKDSLLCLQKVERLLCRWLGTGNSRTMAVMLGLARIHWGLGQLDEAIRLQKIVVNARERNYGSDNEETLEATDELGRSYWLNGQYTEALDYAERTKTRMNITLGEDDARTLVAMDRYGVALQSWHRFEESARIHAYVLDMRQKKLEPEHLETLESKNNLAMALMDLKRFDEAENLMHEVYNQRTTKLGKEHPWTLWALCYLAKIMVKNGQLEQAEHLLLGGIDAANRSLPEDHLGILMGKGELARVYSRQGRLDEAFSLLSHTVKRLEETRGREHPDSFYAKWKLAILHQRRGEVDQAIEECQTAVQRARMRLTDAHPLVGIMQADLHQFCQTQQPQQQQEHTDPVPLSKIKGVKRRFEFRARLTW